ncbi:hypothetical protein BJY04DRAFT_212879 [Aspergillus karnatakaensis]|uniref:putative GPI anchored protein n=1 Tax=Aspergillus karnatakaensis TaxID=1810916 RepID=UPI003CCE08F2
MKGLYRGIPLAVLAATAQAQVQVIGGSRGTDIGNAAAIPTKNTVSNSVSEEYTDDHSLELEHEVYIAPGHGHHKRDGPTVIDGPGGVDIGNSADIPTLNEFSSAYSESYTDDHSIDIDKTTIIKPGRHGHSRRGDSSVIGGSKGIDVGNSADIPTLNSFTAAYSEAYDDDHSVDIDETTIIKPGGHGHSRRGHSSAIAGPGGVDVGSSAFIPTVNKFSSSFHGKYKDDHSIDIDKTTIIKGHHDEHPALGFHHPMHEARGDVDVIGGPGGVDIGNSADIPTLNSFTSTFDGYYSDDHSVDIDKTTIVKPHHKARSQRQGEDVDVIGGSGGLDSGDAYAAPTVNSVHTETDEAVDNDHSIKIKAHEVITPGDEEHHGQQTPHYEGHGEEHHSEPHTHGEPQPPVPAGPECTKVHEVVHTVTSTRTAVETQTVAVYPQHPQSPEHDSHSNWEEPSHNYPSAGTPSNGQVTEQAPQDPESGPYESQYPGQSSSEQYPSGSSSEQYPGQSEQYPSSSSSEEYPGQSEQYPSSSSSEEYPGQSEQYPSSSSSEQYPGQESEQYPGQSSHEQYPNESSGEDSSYPEAATPLPHGWKEGSQPAPTGAYHGPASSAYVAEASSFAVIPVQVPSGTPRAHGSVVMASGSTPASSAFRAMPTGASAEEHSRPSPSSHGAVEFTGAAGHVSPITSVFTVLAGVFAVLAFAL